LSIIELHQYALLINLHPLLGACLLPKALPLPAASPNIPLFSLILPQQQIYSGERKEKECDMTNSWGYLPARSALNAFSADFLLFTSTARVHHYCIVDKFLLLACSVYRPRWKKYGVEAILEFGLMALIVPEENTQSVPF